MADDNGRIHDSDDRFAAIVRALHAQTGTQRTLQRAVDLAVGMFERCDHACISLVHRNHRVETPAFSSETARLGDQLQYQLQEGPCLDAIWEQQTIVSGDLPHEQRWPHWGPRAAEDLGIRSMLCFQLYTSRDSLGALNLYSSHVDAFDDAAIAVGFALAAHVAVALAGAQEHDNASSALANSTVIGQAEGILMERNRIDPDDAFEALRQAAAAQHTALHTVAHRLVRTGRLSG